jgi:hypothetical protein
LGELVVVVREEGRYDEGTGMKKEEDDEADEDDDDEEGEGEEETELCRLDKRGE